MKPWLVLCSICYSIAAGTVPDEGLIPLPATLQSWTVGRQPPLQYRMIRDRQLEQLIDVASSIDLTEPLPEYEAVWKVSSLKCVGWAGMAYSTSV